MRVLILLLPALAAYFVVVSAIPAPVNLSRGTSPASTRKLLQGNLNYTQLAEYVKKYPLHVAVRANNLAAVKALLQVPGANVNAKDSDGLTPLENGLTCPGICSPDLNGAVAEYLISKGANVRPHGEDLIFAATFAGLADVVKALIKGGSNPNAVSVSSEWKTPLEAAGRGNMRTGPGDAAATATVKVLLAAGANPLFLGRNRPASAAYRSPTCNKVGECTPAQAQKSVDEAFKWPIASHPQAWLLVWKAQEKSAAVVG